MNYEFCVILNGGYCEGTLYIEAKSYDEAYGKAQDEVADGLKDFPLPVDYDIECTEEPDIVVEIEREYENALTKYSSNNVDVVWNEETDEIYIGYHSDNNSFPISEGICYKSDDTLDLDYLCEDLDNLGYSYCLG